MTWVELCDDTINPYRENDTCNAKGSEQCKRIKMKKIVYDLLNITCNDTGELRSASYKSKAIKLQYDDNINVIPNICYVIQAKNSTSL